MKIDQNRRSKSLQKLLDRELNEKIEKNLLRQKEFQQNYDQVLQKRKDSINRLNKRYQQIEKQISDR
jgi:archaellum component FlaC